MMRWEAVMRFTGKRRTRICRMMMPASLGIILVDLVVSLSHTHSDRRQRPRRRRWHLLDLRQTTKTTRKREVLWHENPNRNHLLEEETTDQIPSSFISSSFFDSLGKHLCLILPDCLGVCFFITFPTTTSFCCWSMNMQSMHRRNDTMMLIRSLDPGFWVGNISCRWEGSGRWKDSIYQ